METLVLIPQELGLGPTTMAIQHEAQQDDGSTLAIYSEQLVAKGTRFLPFQGTVRLAKLRLEGFLPECDVRNQFGCLDVVQQVDGSHTVRQCNWVRFLVQKDDNAANIVARKIDHQPVFEAVVSIQPYTLLVVQFEYPPPDYQESPLDLSKSLIPSTTKRRLSQRSLLPCEVCGKSFDRPSLLKRHMRTHTGEKPHICEVCSKGFSTSSSLNTHRRIHSGEKPHQCLVCGKRFTASSNLYYHRMTHTKEKPHKCGQCAKSFPTPGDLKAHAYTHSGSWPFRCAVCSRGFSKQTNLRNHLFLHTGDRPHCCHLCGKKFALACNLRAHIKTHHNDSDEASDDGARARLSNVLSALYSQNEVPNTKVYNDLFKQNHADTACRIPDHESERHHNSEDTAQSTISINKSMSPVMVLPSQVHPYWLLRNMSSNTCENATKHPTGCSSIKSSGWSNQFDVFQGLNMSKASNILEEIGAKSTSLNSSCNNLQFSIFPGPFSLNNMHCLTSMSLVDLHAFLLMQAANMAAVVHSEDRESVDTSYLPTTVRISQVEAYAAAGKDEPPLAT